MTRAFRRDRRCDTLLCVSYSARRAFAVVSAVLLLVPALRAQQAPDQSGVVSPPSGFVHTHDANLVDAQGQPLLLKGINLGNWFEPEGYMFHFDDGPQSPREIEDLTKELLGPAQAEPFWIHWRAMYINQADMDLLAKSGFNSVRVPIHWKFFTDDYSEGFQLIDRLLSGAKKGGNYRN